MGWVVGLIDCSVKRNLSGPINTRSAVAAGEGWEGGGGGGGGGKAEKRGNN